MGRPTDYTEILDTVARNHMKNGGTIQSLADLIGVVKSTIDLWRVKHSSFSDAVATGKIDQDKQVESKMLETALGNTFIKKQKVVVVDGKIKKEWVEEQIAPNAQTQKYWLQNRKPDRWKQQQTIEHKGELTLEQMIAGAGEVVAEEIPEAEVETQTYSQADGEDDE